MPSRPPDSHAEPTGGAAPDPASDPRGGSWDRLVDALPPPPTRVGLAAGPAGSPSPDRALPGLAERLESAGHTLVRPEAAKQEAKGLGAKGLDAPGLDTVVVPWDGGDGDATATAALATFADLRNHLAPEGRLVLVSGLAAAAGPGGDPGWVARRRTRRLYEAGFAILDEIALPDEGARGRAREAATAATGDGPALVGDGPGAAGLHLTVARRSEHRVRPYRPGDEAAILKLFHRAFHHPRGLERWSWQYAENPYGNRKISLAVDGDGALAAHYAGYPVHVWADAGVLTSEAGRLDALQIGDTMTAPEARRVGRGSTSLLTRTVNHYYATFCRGRVAFNFGANVGKIQRFSRRTAGARRLEDAPFRSRSLDQGPFAGAPGGLAARWSGWRVERISTLPREGERPGANLATAVRGAAADFDDLWLRARAAYRLLVERDHRYLAWRYSAPDVAYHLWAVYRRHRMVGWSVFRHELRDAAGQPDPRLVWGDALFDPDEPAAPAFLLSHVTSAPEHRDAHRVVGWLSDRPAWWRRCVEALGFRREPEPEDLGFVYVPFEVDPGPAFARDLYYTKGDTDLF